MRTLTITVPEAAERLGIGLRRAYESARAGEIPTIRMGRRILVPIAALEAMLAGNRPLATPPDKSAPRRRYRRRGQQRPGRRGAMAPDPQPAS